MAIPAFGPSDGLKAPQLYTTLGFLVHYLLSLKIKLSGRFVCLFDEPLAPMRRHGKKTR
jgi:hypothetical protein